MYGMISEKLYEGRRNARERQIALEILSHALRSVDPISAVKNHMRVERDILIARDNSYSLNEYDNVIVVGAGKASASMAEAVENILGDRITKGMVNVNYGNTANTKKITFYQAGHPIPDERSVEGTEKILELLESSKEKDLVICLISGGASALMTKPVEGVTLMELQCITNALLRSGARIHEINTVRKHLCQLKGGKLARLAFPSQILSLILSDVVGNNLDIIASGPTVPDSSNFYEALEIIRRYNLPGIPVSILSYLERGAEGKIEENPDTCHPVFHRVLNLIIGSNEIAALAALERAAEYGMNALLLSTFVEGESREIARMFVAIAKEVHTSGNPVKKPACIVACGETTVHVKGKGRGGRNQEFALSAASVLNGFDNIVIVSSATDGTDGPTDAAGGIIDAETAQRGKAMGLDIYKFLEDNNSYEFLKKVGDLIVTGPTNTNVNDLILALVF